MSFNRWWLLPLVIKVVFSQSEDISLDLDEPLDEPIFEVDFSESDVSTEQVNEPQMFDTLEESASALTKKIFGSSLAEQKRKEAELIAEMHKQREALEARLSLNENELTRGRGPMGRGPFNRRTDVRRLDFGVPGPSRGSEAPKSSEPKKKSEKLESEDKAPPAKKQEKLQDRKQGIEKQEKTNKGKISDEEIAKLLATNLQLNIRSPKSNMPIRCHECENVPNAEKCLKFGKLKTCQRGEACQTEVRWENGNVKLESKCKQKNACMVATKQNDNCNRLKGKKGVNRTCWRCCTTDLCNLGHINPDRI